MKVESESSGVVWKVLKEPGDTVEAGESLLLLELMKMEIPVVAPRAGRIERILVGEGDAVEEDQVVAVLSRE